tara:strand:- start:453 stop:623 length:171 start_codon:yes stop_codon:yes gene_type:complete
MIEEESKAKAIFRKQGEQDGIKHINQIIYLISNKDINLSNYWNQVKFFFLLINKKN